MVDHLAVIDRTCIGVASGRGNAGVIFLPPCRNISLSHPVTFLQRWPAKLPLSALLGCGPWPAALGSCSAYLLRLLLKRLGLLFCSGPGSVRLLLERISARF
jgi:hypothetical protein